jgi:hypothetical protein
MNLLAILGYVGIWSLIGAAGFSLIVIILFRAKVVFAARNEKGHLKKEIPLKGILSMLAFLILIVAFLVAANYASLITKQITLGYWSLFLLNMAIIFILIAYDTLVIDWWVIGLWRPSFLQLPDAMNKTEMKKHIRRSFVIAPIFGMLLALVSAAVSVILWE